MAPDDQLTRCPKYFAENLVEKNILGQEEEDQSCLGRITSAPSIAEIK